MLQVMGELQRVLQAVQLAVVPLVMSMARLLLHYAFPQSPAC